LIQPKQAKHTPYRSAVKYLADARTPGSPYFASELDSLNHFDPVQLIRLIAHVVAAV
jgi:hypothetical protein